MINIEEFSKSNELFDGHYKLLRPLSTDGGTADVWLAIDTNTIDSSLDEDDTTVPKSNDSGMLVAIKIYRPKNALDVEGEQRFRDEYKIVYECRHANLVQPTSFSIFEDTPYLVLPYCRYGSSEQFIGKKQTSDAIWKLILDVASGLNRLHTNDPQIVHQDIKPANVLIDNSRNFAITDFGISSRRGGAHGFYFDDENSGTLAYMAPERFREGTEAIPQSDIWAFGATLCEILTGKVPFGEDGGSAQVANGGMPMPAITNAPADVQRLIHACLSVEPGDRPTAEEIKAAAMAKQYPLKSKKWIYAVASVLMAVILAGVVFVVTRPAAVTEKEISIEEMYAAALQRLDSDNKDSVALGLKQMESLCNKDYVPALYEVAYTYGWYGEEHKKSLKRKNMLGIVYSEESDKNKKIVEYMPVNDSYNDKARYLFGRILELNDSAYASQNANAAYRLACYYIQAPEKYAQDWIKGKQYLLISQKWAEMTNNTTLLDNIKAGLNYINEKK